MELFKAFTYVNHAVLVAVSVLARVELTRTVATMVTTTPGLTSPMVALKERVPLVYEPWVVVTVSKSR